MRRLSPGIVVAIEGIDGAGKTTQIGLLGDQLERAGFGVVRTKEPTNGRYGRRLRESALRGRLSPKDELETFINDRREHVETTIRPAIEEGEVVLVDRYYFSTAAYQGALGFDVDEILQRNEEFAPEPNLLVVLSVTPETALSRIESRGEKKTTFERQDYLEL